MEKRKHARQNVDSYCWLRKRGGDYLPVKMVNFSQGGVMVLCSIVISQGQPICASLDLPGVGRLLDVMLRAKYAVFEDKMFKIGLALEPSQECAVKAIGLAMMQMSCRTKIETLPKGLIDFGKEGGQ